MDPNDAQNIVQYLQLFGHPPPGISPQTLQLVQALQAAKARAPAAAAAPTPAPVAPPRASPGVGGAIKDAIKAVSGAVAPRSITQQPGRLAAQEAANQ